MITRRECKILHSIYQQCAQISQDEAKGLGNSEVAGYDLHNTTESLESKMVKLYHDWRDAAREVSQSLTIKVTADVSDLNKAFEELSKSISLYTNHLTAALHTPPVIKVTPQTNVTKVGNAKIIVDDIPLAGMFTVETPGYSLIPDGHTSEAERQKIIKEKLKDLQQVQQEAAHVLLGINARNKGLSVDMPMMHTLAEPRSNKIVKFSHEQLSWPIGIPEQTVKGCNHCFNPVCYVCLECHQCKEEEDARFNNFSDLHQTSQAIDVGLKSKHIQVQMPWPSGTSVLDITFCFHCRVPLCYWCRECHGCRDNG